MAKTPREYERLPGSGFQSQGRIPVALFRSRLYLGADHLLRVEFSSFSEKYRRFYFADIKSIVLVKTNAWLILPIVCLVLLFPCAFGIYSTLENGAALFFLSIPTVILLYLAVSGLLRGRSCRAEIRTRAGLETLPALSRLRPARRALEKIVPLIVAAQGELGPPSGAEWQSSLERFVANSGFAVSTASRPAPPSPLKFVRYSPWLIWPTPVLALLSGLLFAAAASGISGWLMIAAFGLGTLMLVPAVAALVRLKRASAFGLFGCNLLATCFGVIVLVTAYVEYIVASVRIQMKLGERDPNIFANLFSTPPFPAEVQMIISLCLAITLLGTGIAGLFRAVAYAKISAQFPPPAPPPLAQ
jgi:hypothetical protein